MAMATTKRQMIVKIQFNENFREYNRTKKRYRLAKGSAGSGKSVNTAQDYIIKLGDPNYKGSNLLCVRKVAESNKDSTFAELKAAIYKYMALIIIDSGLSEVAHWNLKIKSLVIK